MSDVLEQKILNLLQQNGPNIPAVISKSMEQEAMFVNAMLSVLKNKGLVKTSYLKIGSSSIYYLLGQENKVREMLYERLDKREKELLTKIDEQQKINQQDLTPPERFFLKNLLDFIKIEQNNNQIIIHSLKKIEKPTILIEQQKLPTKKILKTSIKKQTDKDEFLTNINQFFNQKNVIILKHESLRKNNEHDFVVRIKNQLTTQEYYLKAYKKKSVNEKDLTQTWFTSQKKQLPSILLTTGNLTKKAQIFLKQDLQNKIHIIKI